MAGKDKAPRRTPAQLAQDRLAGAQSRLAQKLTKQARLKAELAETEQHITELSREVEYLGMHPALPGKLDGNQTRLPTAAGRPLDD